MTDTATLTQTDSASGAAEIPTSELYGVMAEFETPAEIMHAAETVRDAGYRWWDCHTPFPVHGLDGAMGIKPTILPILVFFCGLTGCIAGILLQWFTNATGLSIWALVDVTGYPYLISGKPMWSLPANIPVIFELTILFSAGGCVLLMLMLNQLPMWYHPTLKSERFRRVTDDRFFLVIEARDPQFFRQKTTTLLQSMNPVHIEELEQ